jgi:hypothetical protein
MKTPDFLQQYIEDSQRLSKQLEAYTNPGLNSITDAVARSTYLSEIERFTAQMDLASHLGDSKLFEAARVASGQLEGLKASIAASSIDYAETIRRMTEVPDSVKMLQETVLNYEKQFRLSNNEDLLRLSDLTSKMAAPEWVSNFSTVGLEFQRQLEMIQVPFIQMEDSLKSLRGFSELSAIGTAVRLIEPFDSSLVQSLRRDLGDWRDMEVDATDLLDDPVGRVALYEEQGFNPELTDFPAQGFESALTVTGIDLGSVSTALAPPSADMVPVFNVQAYQWLFVFERELRAFIVKRLTEAGSGNWEVRLPPGMRDKWKEKKAKALAEGESEQPLIHYADFADYNDIILGQANWRDCFKGTFKREEAVREGFNRLRPIRLVTAHMRVLTHEEWLVLNLEIRRLLRAIGVL